MDCKCFWGINTLFKDEKALRKYVCEKLIEEGYELIGTDAAVYKRKTVDILARKENKTTAIEVKRSGRRGIADDIGKLERLAFVPEIDFFYVAVPKMNLQDDILAFANRLEVGVIGVTELGIEWLVESKEKDPSPLRRSVSLPSTVEPGGTFEFRISIMAAEAKMVRNTEIMYMSAWPFRVPKNERNHRVIKELMPGKEESVSFKIRVENDAEEGYRPLFSRITRPGMKADNSLYRIKVSKRREIPPIEFEEEK